MEFYFNPYPGAAVNYEQGKQATLKAIDAWKRLSDSALSTNLDIAFSDMPMDNPLKLTLIYDKNSGAKYTIKQLFYDVRGGEIERLRLLLTVLARGRHIKDEELIVCEDWLISGLEAPVPILELAARNQGAAFTIATEPEWATDRIEFVGRSEWIHNLWGQNDVSMIRDYCVSQIEDQIERFSKQFNAVFCSGAENTFPPDLSWDSLRIFEYMKRAQERNYVVDMTLISRAHVAMPMNEPLLELRCYGSGARIFFVYRPNDDKEIIVGGFYQKNMGLSEDTSIQTAAKRIFTYNNTR